MRQNSTRATSSRAKIRQWLSDRRRVAALAAAGVLMIGAVLWATLSSTGPKPRSREYLTFKACLLTDAHGVTGKEAAPVWAGMEKASLKTRAKVQYLPAFGPATTANTQPYLHTLIQQQCNVIVAVGAGPVAAATTEAPNNPHIDFDIVAGNTTGRNVTTLNSPPNQMSTTVSNAIIHQVHAG